MRSLMRLLTAALAGLLCLTPLALAQGAQGSGSLHTDHASGAADLAASQDGADATAALDDSASLDAETDHSVDAADGLWAWLHQRFTDIVAPLGGMLGHAPAVDPSVDASADVQVGLDGATVGVDVAGVSLGQTVALPAVGVPADLGAGAGPQLNAGSSLGLG